MVKLLLAVNDAPKFPPLLLAREVILFIGLALAVPVLLALTFAQTPGPNIPGLVAWFAGGLFVTEISTSFLLIVRFREARTWSLLLLSCAFFYSALMAIPHLATFPGAILTDQPLISLSRQATSWIFVLWINGFACLVLISVFLEAWFSEFRVAENNSPACRDGGAHLGTARGCRDCRCRDCLCRSVAAAGERHELDKLELGTQLGFDFFDGQRGLY